MYWVNFHTHLVIFTWAMSESIRYVMYFPGIIGSRANKLLILWAGTHSDYLLKMLPFKEMFRQKIGLSQILLI
jgi:hypothetical protein